MSASGEFDAVIIGSGLSGLTTGRFLAESGKRVIILEKHNIPGGMTHTFQRKGYEWDVGLHYVGGQVGSTKSPMRMVYDFITDGQLQWQEMDEVFDRVLIAGEEFEIGRGREEQQARVIAQFPQEERAIKKYFDIIQGMGLKSQIYFGEKSMPPWLSFFVGRPLRYPFLSYARKTTYEVLRSLTDNEMLIAVLCAQCGDYGLPPSRSSFGIHALVVEHYLRGGYYPIGGGRRIFETAEPGLKKLGAEIRLKAGVERILLERGRVAGVRLESGEEIRSKLVVSGAGVRNTIEQFLPQDIPFVQRANRDLQNLKPSIGHVCLYLGLNAGQEQLQLPNCNYWVYDSFNFNEEFEKLKSYGPNPQMAYVSSGSRRDGGWNQPGKTTMQVLSACDYSNVESWENTRWRKRGADYEEMKQEYTRCLLKYATDLFPQIAPHVEYTEVSTPLSTKHFASAPRGEMYGLEHTPARFNTRWLRPRTPIPGLYMTGQDTLAVGITSALFSGVLTATSILHPTGMWRVWNKSPVKIP